MKIGVVVPTRGDRPGFLKRCKQMIAAQTLQPVQVVFVDYPPVSDDNDITARYRYGYEQLSNTDVDVIAFMEDDDWYSGHYLATMFNAWDNAGRPDLFGLNFTVYYHLKLRKWCVLRHPHRAAAMCTFIKPGLPVDWPKGVNEYTDLHLWMVWENVTGAGGQVTGVTKHLWDGGISITEDGVITGDLPCMGIKHGVGKLGSGFHIDKLDRYRYDDNGFLEELLERNGMPGVLHFYKSFSSAATL